MTRTERSRLVTESFDDLWKELWSFDKKNKKYEYIEANNKYTLFKKGMTLKNSKTLSLEAILSQTNSTFDDPETKIYS